MLRMLSIIINTLIVTVNSVCLLETISRKGSAAFRQHSPIQRLSAVQKMESLDVLPWNCGALIDDIYCSCSFILQNTCICGRGDGNVYISPPKITVFA